MEYMFMPLRKYADFQGRSRRMEYWMFFLFVLAVYVVLFLLSLMLGGGAAMMGGNDSAAAGGLGIGMILIFVFALAMLIPGLAVQVRRFHDQNLTGWLVLLNLIPYLGALAVFVFMLLPGTAGPNKFGPDPKGGDDATVFN